MRLIASRPVLHHTCKIPASMVFGALVEKLILSELMVWITALPDP